jgi:hypothetical protein
VLFKQSQKQALSWAGDPDAPYLHRWWLVIARCDLSKTREKEVSVLSVNGAEGGPAYRQPRIYFDPIKGSFGSQLNDGRTKNEAVSCSRAFEDWNVLLGYRRGFMTQAVVNGIKSEGQTILSLYPNAANSPSFMGDVHDRMRANLAIDSIIIGQSELDDSQIDSLMGWAMWRVGRQSALPEKHPYARQPPRVEAGLVAAKTYTFNSAGWSAWKELSQGRYAHRGQPAPEPQGYDTVLFDDFEQNSVVDDISGDPTSIWFAPTHLTNVGVEAQTQRVSDRPSSYVHDPVNHTLALRLVYSKRWRTGAFSSVNKNGQGRTWSTGIFEIRAKLPKMAAPRPGFFPAFWSYGREHLFWRTRNRLETDFWEYDALDGTYINISQHVHKPVLKYDAANILEKDVRWKMAGYELDPSNGFAKTIDVYDGEFHTWYAQIEPDYTYFVVDGLEVARVKSSTELKADKYIMVDFAYTRRQGRALPDLAAQYDMVIDYIKVRQLRSELAQVPPGFKALPSLSGTPRVGSILTVAPNVSASQIEYRWYRNGKPILGESNETYTLISKDVGQRIRCHVRAASLRDQPHAWSPESAAVA